MAQGFALRSTLAALAASIGLAACGGSDAPAPANGTLRVSLTDAPGCRIGEDTVEAVYVTVERVRVHASRDAGEGMAGWTDLAVNPPKRINLLDLTNGRLEELGTTPIPAGHYTQVRLVLRPDTGNTAHHSLMLAGQTQEIALRTPSAMQSGLKVIRPFTVEPDTLADLVLDFDACRSIVMMGSGAYALKPTLTATMKTVAGIVGFVDPAVGDATVSAQKDGVVYRSTTPYATGQFVLAYLDPAAGPYTFVVTSPSRGTSVVTGVGVSTSAVTTLSTQAQPIPLPAAGTPPSRVASGTVTATPSTALQTATVRAVQVVGSVPKVEVATTTVNAGDGTYSLTLPTAVPWLAPYAGILPLVFTAQPAPAPAYTLEASVSGVVKSENIGTGTASATWNPAF